MVKIRKYFVAGLLAILPISLSIYILVILFRLTDGILGRFLNVYLENTLGFYIPGLGLILFISIIFFVGILSIHVFGTGLHRLFDNMLGRFPLIRHIYPSIRKVFEFIFSDNKTGFKKTVLIEYPYKGLWSLGFIANEGFKEAQDRTGRKLFNVYIPMVPNPTTGFFVLVPEDQLMVLNMNVHEAMKLIMSAGVLNPLELVKS